LELKSSPEARIRKAVAANAGFYTFPDENLEYPYGLKNTPITDTSSRNLLKNN